jgi:hypothetical protein
MAAPSCPDSSCREMRLYAGETYTAALVRILFRDAVAIFRDALETITCYNSRTGLMEADNTAVTSRS